MLGFLRVESHFAASAVSRWLKLDIPFRPGGGVAYVAVGRERCFSPSPLACHRLGLVHGLALLAPCQRCAFICPCAPVLASCEALQIACGYCPARRCNGRLICSLRCLRLHGEFIALGLLCQHAQLDQPLLRALALVVRLGTVNLGFGILQGHDSFVRSPPYAALRRPDTNEAASPLPIFLDAKGKLGLFKIQKANQKLT